MIRKIIKDFFIVSLTTWLLLVFWELADAGAVQRFINLEYYFYGLLIISLYLRLTSTNS